MTPTAVPRSSPEPTYSWYTVTAEVKDLLSLAAQAWADTAQADAYITQAINHPAATMDVLVSAYRYFFYKSNLPMARRLTEEVMARVRSQEGLSDNWEQILPWVQSQRDNPAVRLYLTAYAAQGMVLARLGQLEAAAEVASRVKAIDERNEFGANFIHNVLSASPEEED